MADLGQSAEQGVKVTATISPAQGAASQHVTVSVNLSPGQADAVQLTGLRLALSTPTNLTVGASAPTGEPGARTKRSRSKSRAKTSPGPLPAPPRPRVDDHNDLRTGPHNWQPARRHGNSLCMTTAWVLRGGASFGAAQVGMARALIEAGHHPDLLYGTSAGALNAAWLAADPTLEGIASLARLWTSVRRRDVFPIRPELVAGRAWRA